MQAINSWPKNGHRNFPAKRTPSPSCITNTRAFFSLQLLLRVFKYRFQLTSHFSSAGESSQIFENEIIMILFGLEKCSHSLQRQPNSPKTKETHTLNKLNFIAHSAHKKSTEKKEKICARQAQEQAKSMSSMVTIETQINENKKSN